ncbi:hypothetical protein A5819_002409 [Enterococcus sp. 7E2_DIV0204]|uniref:Uncharacterized protein n=1 Tax=Candidatus Enterococcus lemimoniae TaxID=1834167 RepID=A0ABZ2T3L6_9ENTE|nr:MULTISPECIES: hypothetical protein [unclassified Enterococcus]OTN89911.1 hypothetical protein A5819_002409 [Enterococcus sp. 7E2_DIV0204]OTO68774.1 hypothetical protein A5866_000972 [Enterococcus sp. 12C11_DIV0727]OTP52367.1 hypothetical protein A5884_001568 [Enterococcus sp. 7D2_DIV0200]
MSLLDWFFIGQLSFATLSFLFIFFFFFYSLSIRKELKKAKWQKRPKNKAKRKRWIKERKQLEKRRKQFDRNIFIFLLFVIIASGSAFYSRYYQMTHLTAEDAKGVVQGYFMSEDIEKKLETMRDGGSIEKEYQAYLEISSLIVTYSNRSVSDGLSEEGKRLLTRYNVSMKNLGMNLHSLSEQQLENKETIDGYLKDIQKMKQQQKEVFKYFRVNESALKRKG